MGLNVRNEIIVIAYNLNMYHNIIYIYIYFAKLSRASHGLATSFLYKNDHEILLNYKGS